MRNRLTALVMCLSFTVALLGLQESFLSAQAAAAETPANHRRIAAGDQPTVTTLESIRQAMAGLKRQLAAKQAELAAAATDAQKADIIQDIKNLDARLDTLEDNFEEIATGINLQTFSERPKEKFDWSEEMQEILGPIIQELRGLTARPRELERLRNEVDYYQKRIPIAKRAIGHLQQLIEKTDDPRLRQELSVLVEKWQSRVQEISSNLAVARYQLDEKRKEQKSVVGSVQNILQIFFKSRGRNFVLAFLAFVLVWLLLRYMYRLVYKYSPYHRSAERTFYLRLADLIYEILTFVGAAAAALLVLYIAADWVLLGVAIIFLFGLVWAGRQALPKFWEQGKLLLNLGTVRERERIVYNGIAWRVESLQFYSHLKNPELKGGLIRLPLRELMDLKSRPYQADEPWFPCRENDWVILGDGTLGKVVTQTPEIVELVLLGGSRKTYRTPDFLAQTPNNISTNFRLKVTFGIDYQHQAASTRQVPQQLAAMIVEELEAAGYSRHLINLDVEFKAAGASSLDLEILADFAGEAARHYETLTRSLQRIAVDACNKYGWVIPFTQVTLHTPPQPDAKSAAAGE